jgi:hypothetical protein
VPLGSQRYGAQVTGIDPTHAPWPLHFESAVALFDVGSQLPFLQTTLFQRAHCPMPSHVPSCPQLLCDSMAQMG